MEMKVSRRPDLSLQLMCCFSLELWPDVTVTHGCCEGQSGRERQEPLMCVKGMRSAAGSSQRAAACWPHPCVRGRLPQPPDRCVSGRPDGERMRSHRCGGEQCGASRRFLTPAATAGSTCCASGRREDSASFTSTWRTPSDSWDPFTGTAASQHWTELKLMLQTFLLSANHSQTSLWRLNISKYKDPLHCGNFMNKMASDILNNLLYSIMATNHNHDYFCQYWDHNYWTWWNMLHLFNIIKLFSN